MKHPTDPLVSVIISTYDRPKFLDRALASVCDQAYDDFDVWVVDDHSPDVDAVGDVMEKWTKRFEARGITMWAVRTPYNSGYQCFPKNVGIMQSCGELIGYLDDDNRWLPNHLSDLVAAFMSNDIDMVYGGRRYINESDDPGLTTGDVLALPWKPKEIVAQNYIDTSDMLHSRGALTMLMSATGRMWDENLMRFGDWDFVSRWAKTGLNAMPVEGIHSEYYWHGNNLQITRPVSNQPVAMPLSQYRAFMELKAKDDAAAEAK